MIPNVFTNWRTYVLFSFVLCGVIGCILYLSSFPRPDSDEYFYLTAFCYSFTLCLLGTMVINLTAYFSRIKAFWLISIAIACVLLPTAYSLDGIFFVKDNTSIAGMSLLFVGVLGSFLAFKFQFQTPTKRYLCFISIG